ncbi:AMP-binding protein [Aquisalimonas lutea]|uniref:AMP-binding protein n=1 Tax=Aquisalimonas lutea TaxID=1327750 RepID=UPI0025B33DF4|nr:AMP-binding protein [Aquisalimonas lutea]MDN3516534.1 AMP-binding protein [Aquisalimonas lutea]
MFDLGRSLVASVERRPHADAVVQGDMTLSYQAWFREVQSAARGLGELGLRHGDRLLAVMQNRWQLATLHWACQCAGVVITPLNWRATGDDVDYCLQDAEARAVFFDDAAAAAVGAADSAAGVPRVAVGGPVTGAWDYADLCATAPAGTILRGRPDDLSVMLYTSGTTSRPKGVPRRHRVERAAALAHVAQNRYAHGERTLGVMPLYHTMGVRSLLAMALVDGCFVCQPRFDAEETLDLIERQRITNLYLVPTLYHALLEHEAFAPERVRGVEKLGYAGAPMSAGLMQRVNEAFRPELFVNHYGSSEIYTFTIDQDAARKPGSSGRSGLNQRIRVVAIDADDPAETLPPGREGEIIADLAGDEAFDGYWKRPDGDAKAIRHGWYFTGDTGYFDEEGDLFVTGRVDDLIITGGENVSPAEIEDALSLHPAVEEVIVVGMPDERWGEVVTAFVRRRGEVTEEALDQHCRSSGIANFKRPRRYVFVREIPKSPVGKILRRELRASNYAPE